MQAGEKEESIAISPPRRQAKNFSLGQVRRVLIATLVLAFPLHAGDLPYGPALQHPSSDDHRLPGHIAIRCPTVGLGYRLPRGYPERQC